MAVFVIPAALQPGSMAASPGGRFLRSARGIPVFLAVWAVLLSCEKHANPVGMDPNTGLAVPPVVQMTNSDYDGDGMFRAFWDTDAWKAFSKAYNGKYSDGLRDSVIAEMRHLAQKLWLDPDRLESCIRATGEIRQDGLAVLPCLAERARFLGKDVWIVVFVWGMRSLPTDMVHVRYYAVDLHAREVLHFKTCK